MFSNARQDVRKRKYVHNAQYCAEYSQISNPYVAQEKLLTLFDSLSPRGNTRSPSAVINQLMTWIHSLLVGCNRL